MRDDGPRWKSADDVFYVDDTENTVVVDRRFFQRRMPRFFLAIGDTGRSAVQNYFRREFAPSLHEAITEDPMKIKRVKIKI
jgi:hypothetical protein